MKLHKDTARIQEDLGEFCRTGSEIHIPGVTPGRLHHYRRLVNNVVRDSLDSAFPITVAALGEETWDLLVQDFFSSGVPATPMIWKMPFEFYSYHAGQETGKRIQKAFLDDLLYFEWMEIEVYNMPNRAFPAFTSEGSILEEPLAFNPEYEIIQLEYPVHMHPAERAAELRGEYFVLIFRSPDTGFVQFINLSVLYTYILTRLAEEGLPINHLKGEVARATGIESGKYMDDAMEQFITDLMDKRLILGFKKV
ncbi:MAG: hypothetical protein GY790_00140 [Bacteroidetes bacterium]|nr:hypothetical protein [Bacteroidota bacterium]